MNQPEDRPPTGNRPAPSDDLPAQPPAWPSPGGRGPQASTDGLARVVGAPLRVPPTPPVADGEVTTPPPPNTAGHEAPVPVATGPVADPGPSAASAAPSTMDPDAHETKDDVAGYDDDDEDQDDDFLDEVFPDDDPSRWAGFLATVGTALVGIVGVQVVATVVEGVVLKRGERVGNIPEDIFHRLGYPFGGLGATALVFLVLGVVLLALPSVLDAYLSPSQDRVVRLALVMSVVIAVVVAIGSLLAVRANLHEYSAKGVAVPGYVRVQFTNFLLGSLGAAALALFAAIATLNERGRAPTT